MRKRKFVVKIENQGNKQVKERMIFKHSFEEVMPEAYSFKRESNDRTKAGSDWKIVSVKEFSSIGDV